MWDFLEALTHLYCYIFETEGTRPVCKPSIQHLNYLLLCILIPVNQDKLHCPRNRNTTTMLPLLTFIKARRFSCSGKCQLIFCLSVCGLLILGHCHYNTFHGSTLYTYYFVGSMLFEWWMYTTTHYENNAASFSCFIFHHFRVTLDTNLLHTHIHTHIYAVLFVVVIVTVLNGTAHWHLYWQQMNIINSESAGGSRIY
jgi:hypothetical protein